MRPGQDLAAVIFDMDGVLIDSEPLHYESTIRYLNHELGLSYSEQENLEFLGRTDEFMFRVLKERYRLPYSVRDMIERRRDVYLELLRGQVKLIPGVVELVRLLKQAGYKLAVATSSLQAIMDVVVTEGGIKQCFDVLQSGEHLAHGKPHPEIFLSTARKLGVAPQLCAVVEDTTVGIQAAKAAGMCAIAYAAPSAPEQDFSVADAMVTSAARLSDILMFPRDTREA